MRDPDPPKPKFTFSILVLSDPVAHPVEYDSEWNRVFTEFDPRLRSFFGRRVDSGDDLDDLVGHIWRKALSKIDTLRAPEAMWSWLLQIGENKLKDWNDASKSRAKFEERLAVDVNTNEDLRLGDDSGDELFNEDFFARNPHLDRDAILARIETLKDRDRQMLEMHQNGEGHDSIARALGFPSVEASRQHLARIKKKIRGG